MTMATAGADGDPWVSPVYFAAGDRDGLLWLSVTFACIDRRRRGHSSPSAPGRIEIDEKVNLAQKFELLEAPYEPAIVGYLNDLKLQIVKVDGPFVWHKHDETDDFFLVFKGRLTIHLRDRDVELSEGELFVVPRGVEHCPEASEEAHVLLIEPRGTVNTGDAGGELTAEPREL